jgi:3-hydroxypropanoate dehydrogenase
MIDQAALDALFLKARSHNAMGGTVSDDTLRRLYDIAKMGPTTSNSQPMRVVFVRTTEGKEKLAPALSNSNRPKTLAAPVTAIIAYSLDFPDDMDRFYHVPGAGKWYTSTEELRRDTALRNSSLQGAYFMLAARALGLDVGPMSGFDNAKVDAAFFPDGRTKSNFLCNLGRGDPATLHPLMPRRTFEESCTFA